MNNKFDIILFFSLKKIHSISTSLKSNQTTKNLGSVPT